MTLSRERAPLNHAGTAVEGLAVYQRRSGLTRTRRKLEQGALTVGFIGGSITCPGGQAWPEPVIAWFLEHFPHVRITVENAAIGATGSPLAVFRAQRELIDRQCDLVFIEYAVNDDASEHCARTREGLIRKLLADAGRDLVLVYTYRPDMYEDMTTGRIPPSIAGLERLGEHYGISSVWMGLYALREQMKGSMRWQDWLPDGIHPQQRGSLCYAQSVTAFLRTELLSDQKTGGALPAGDKLPAPLTANNWEHAYALPWTAVQTDGPWCLRRWAYGLYLDTAAVGAKLSFAFKGRALALGFNFGKASCEFLYRLDRGAVKRSQRDRPAWMGPEGLYSLYVVADDLPSEEHTFEMEVIHGYAAEATGTDCRLALIGIVP